jgi:hypothetical protein
MQLFSETETAIGDNGYGNCTATALPLFGSLSLCILVLHLSLQLTALLSQASHLLSQLRSSRQALRQRHDRYTEKSSSCLRYAYNELWVFEGKDNIVCTLGMNSLFSWCLHCHRMSVVTYKQTQSALAMVFHQHSRKDVGTYVNWCGLVFVRMSG